MSDFIKEFEAFAACPLDLVCEPAPPLLFPDSNRPVFPLLARKQPKKGRLALQRYSFCRGVSSRPLARLEARFLF